MFKKILFLLIFSLSLAGCGANQTIAPTEKKMIFFYGDGCPHCQNVEKYMAENKVSEKIDMDVKEIYKDKVAAQLFMDKNQACGIDTKNAGVPLLWNDGKCLVGDQDIINFFSQQLEAVK